MSTFCDFLKLYRTKNLSRQNGFASFWIICTQDSFAPRAGKTQLPLINTCLIHWSVLEYFHFLSALALISKAQNLWLQINDSFALQG